MITNQKQMMKYFTLVGALLIGLTATAQNSKLVSADSYIDEFERDSIPEDLVKAKEALMEAKDHEKTKDQKRTWYYFGKLYFLMNTDESLAAAEPDALKKALESYERFEKSSGKFFYEDDYKMNLDRLVRTIYNIGIQHFQNEDYAKAYDMLSLVGRNNSLLEKNGVPQVIQTNKATELAGKAAILDGKVDEGLGLLVGLYNETDSSAYALTATQIMTSLERYEEAKEILTEITENEPDNLEAMAQLVDVYLRQDKASEVMDKINKLVEANPEDAKLYMVRGETHLSMGNKENAIADFEKSLEIDPDYVYAYHNLGGVYVKTANELLQEMDNLPLSAQKEYDALQENRIEQLKKALNYLEQAKEKDTEGSFDDLETIINSIKRQLNN